MKQQEPQDESVSLTMLDIPFYIYLNRLLQLVSFFSQHEMCHLYDTIPEEPAAPDLSHVTYSTVQKH